VQYWRSESRWFGRAFPILNDALNGVGAAEYRFGTTRITFLQ
jgi:hypothetical protein